MVHLDLVGMDLVRIICDNCSLEYVYLRVRDVKSINISSGGMREKCDIVADEVDYFRIEDTMMDEMLILASLL